MFPLPFSGKKNKGLDDGGDLPRVQFQVRSGALLSIQHMLLTLRKGLAPDRDRITDSATLPKNYSPNALVSLQHAALCPHVATSEGLTDSLGWYQCLLLPWGPRGVCWAADRCRSPCGEVWPLSPFSSSSPSSFSCAPVVTGEDQSVCTGALN